MKLTISELKKHLKQLDSNEIIQLIAELHKIDEKAQLFFSLQFEGEETAQELLIQEKTQMKKDFSFTGRGVLKLHLPDVKKRIREFAKLTNDRMRITDLQLFFVELGTEFTVTYGDIDEAFYTNMENMFAQVIKTCESNEELYKAFHSRLRQVVSDSIGTGWGYHDILSDLYENLEFHYDNEEDY
ncbi:DUF6155 family protein [Sporosarcina cascadiensis]|uniref:DUF6155 family protein n=1 Tax=Sporosarcina cascadiensis TaxID=2660747 RepID=UPI001E43CD9A|nr:DUF6155 family protein [Sporosarcina cascadiensis]